MPYKPTRACAVPKCPNRTQGNSCYCEEHQQQVNKNYEQHQRSYRPSKRYGRAWKRIRDSYAETHPFCEDCLQEKVFTKTEEVHHLLPLSEGGTHAIGNLRALCKRHHSKRHCEENFTPKMAKF